MRFWQTGETWKTVKVYSVDKKNEAAAHGKQFMKDTDACKDMQNAYNKAVGKFK